MKRRADGDFDVTLDEDSREVLTMLLTDLREQIDQAPDHPSLHRLRPPAYLDDPEADAGYQLLAGEELRTSHRAAIDDVIASLTREHITEAEAWSWIQALNAVRLVVGTSLDITDDDHHAEFDDDLSAEERSLWAIYEFTTVIQQAVVVALSA